MTTQIVKTTTKIITIIIKPSITIPVTLVLTIEGKNFKFSGHLTVFQNLNYQFVTNFSNISKCKVPKNLNFQNLTVYKFEFESVKLVNRALP